MKRVNRVGKGKSLGKSSPGRIQFELKARDTAVSVAMDTTGGVLLLNGMVQGTDFDERVGRQIHMKSLELILRDVVTDTTGIDQMHRFLVVVDRQANGVAPGLTDVLTSASVTAPINLANQHRFKVLWDKSYMLNASAEPGSWVIINKVVNINFVTDYNAGVAGTVADINTNSLYLLYIGYRGAGATAGAAAGNARLRYFD